MIARTLGLLLLISAMCTEALAQKGTFAVPHDAELDKFPLFEKILTVEEMTRLSLSPVKIEVPTVVENHYRKLRDKDGRFVLETLPVGTIVLVDKDGVVRYKADCGNRIVVVPEPIKATVTVDEPPPLPPASKPGLWQRFTDAMRGFANAVGALLAPFGWLLLGLLGLVLMALLVYGLYRLIRGIFDRSNQTPTQPAEQPRRTIPPAQTRGTGAPRQDPPVASVPIVGGATPPTTGGPGGTNPPTAASGQERMFFSFTPATDENSTNLFRWGGMEIRNYERGTDGVNTLRFTDQSKKA